MGRHSALLGSGDLLAGEVGWSDTVDWRSTVAALRRKAENLPLAQGRVFLAVWAKRGPRESGRDAACFEAGDVLDALE